MKYKLWSQLEGSDLSPCHYAIHELPFYSPSFPCPAPTSRHGKIFEKVDYFPFFAAVDHIIPVANSKHGGIILSPEYIMTSPSRYTSINVASEIQPGQSLQDAFNGPNVVSGTLQTSVPGALIYRVSGKVTQMVGNCKKNIRGPWAIFYKYGTCVSYRQALGES